MLYVLGVLILLVVAALGVGVLTAGRHLDETDGADGNGNGTGNGTGPASRVAGLVDASVRRTRVAVAELTSTEVHHDDLRPSAAEYSRRGHTYTVLGPGMLGLAVVLLLGLLLLL